MGKLPVTVALSAVLLGGPNDVGVAELPAELTHRRTVALRVSVTDETDRRPPRGKTEVWLRGAGSWFPDLRFGGDVLTYPGRRVGTTDTLVFYPFGRDAPEIRVPVPITVQFCPAGCARDMVRLEIWDDRFEAWGPVTGGKLTVRR